MKNQIIALHLLNSTVVLAKIIGKDEHYRLIIKTDFQIIGSLWVNELEEYYIERYIFPTDEKNIYVIE